MECHREEIFGPVIPVMKFETEEVILVRRIEPLTPQYEFVRANYVFTIIYNVSFLNVHRLHRNHNWN